MTVACILVHLTATLPQSQCFKSFFQKCAQVYALMMACILVHLKMCSTIRLDDGVHPSAFYKCKLRLIIATFVMSGTAVIVLEADIF
ncbi:hypothetical protein BY996DRAFT_7743852, partial [Phakopsora pachyrhizi]